MVLRRVVIVARASVSNNTVIVLLMVRSVGNTVNARDASIKRILLLTNKVSIIRSEIRPYCPF